MEDNTRLHCNRAFASARTRPDLAAFQQTSPDHQPNRPIKNPIMSDECVEPRPKPHVPVLPGHTTSYPWQMCIRRFFRRMIIGAVIWIISLIAVLVNAFAYGSSSGGFSFILIVTSFIVPGWALCGFVPRYGEWERGMGAGRRAPYLWLVMLVVGLGGAGLFHLARRGEVEMRARDVNREFGIRVCSAELKQISAPVSVDSLLIESGIVDASKLRELLGARGLKFVELQARSGKVGGTKENTYGVDAFSGDQTSHFEVAPGVKIVRVALTREGDKACTTEQILGLQAFRGYAPTAPNACPRVDLDTHSRASHALRALPPNGSRSLIKWALVEQATGKVLASLSSSDSPLGPSRQGGGAKDEQKFIDDDEIHCRSPHFSLMNLVYGPPRKQDERLTLGQRPVTLDFDAAQPDKPATWEAVGAPEEAVGDWSTREAARHGPAWKAAYHAAEQSGWAGYEQGVIDFKTGVILRPRRLAEPNRNTVVRGSNHGFMAAWSIGPNSLALAHFGLDGRLLWKRQIMSTLPAADPRARFDLHGMEWDEREVRLYGFRSLAVGEHVAVRVLNVALPRPAAPPRGTSSREKPTLGKSRGPGGKSARPEQ